MSAKVGKKERRRNRMREEQFKITSTIPTTISSNPLTYSWVIVCSKHPTCELDGDSWNKVKKDRWKGSTLDNQKQRTHPIPDGRDLSSSVVVVKVGFMSY